MFVMVLGVAGEESRVWLSSVEKRVWFLEAKGWRGRKEKGESSGREGPWWFQACQIWEWVEERAGTSRARTIPASESARAGQEEKRNGRLCLPVLSTSS